MNETLIDDQMELIKILQEGGMLSEPTLRFHVDRALHTGDFDDLFRYLEAFPMIIANAKRNINMSRYQKLENPFPYPPRDDVKEFLSGPFNLGYVNQFNDMFAINPDIFSMPTIIPGRPGSGKSQFLKYLLIQILRKKRDFNVLIPDLKGNEYRDLTLFSKHLDVITEKHMALNPLQVPEDMTPRDFLHLFAQVFVAENWLGATSLSIIIRTVEQIYRDRGIFDGSSNFPSMLDLYNTISKALQGKSSFKYRDILLLVQNRLIPFVTDPTFNCQRGIPYEFWRTKNLVLEVANFSDNVYSFVVSLIGGYLYEYYRKCGLKSSKLQTLSIVDEARVLFKVRDVMTFGEGFSTRLVTRCRDIGIGFILSSQEFNSFNDTVKSVSFTKICFPLTSGQDLEFVQESFGLNENQAKHVFKLPKHGIAIVRYGGYPEPFLLGVPYFTIKKELSTEEVEQRMADFYAELDIQIKRPDPPAILKTTETVPPAATALLFFLGKMPFTKKSDMTNAAGFNSAREVNKALDWLNKNSFIAIKKYRTSRTKKSSYAVLTDKAYKYLGIKGAPGKGSFEHSLYQSLIEHKLISQVMTVRIEGQMKESNKAIDVLAFSKDTGPVAYEVTLNFHNLLTNIHQDLNAGAKKVVIVTRDKKDLEKAINAVAADVALNKDLEKIDFSIIDDFFE
jgi:hypothetical protein